jgi:hypothetical protein
MVKDSLLVSQLEKNLSRLLGCDFQEGPFATAPSEVIALKNTQNTMLPQFSC